METIAQEMINTKLRQALKPTIEQMFQAETAAPTPIDISPAEREASNRIIIHGVTQALLNSLH